MQTATNRTYVLDEVVLVRRRGRGCDAAGEGVMLWASLRSPMARLCEASCSDRACAVAMLFGREEEA